MSKKTDPKKEQKLTFKHSINSRTKNRRILVVLYQDEDLEFIFRIITKRLVSFKDRIINETDNLYTLESALLISDLLSMAFESQEIMKLLVTSDIFEHQRNIQIGTTLKDLQKTQTWVYSGSHDG